MDRCHRTLTDVDRRRMGTLLSRRDMSALGRPRLRFNLECEIEEASCIPSELTPDSLVTMNSTVVLSEPETGARRTCTLVYPEDRDLFADAVSILQELGGSLLGHSVGDTVEVRETGKVRRLLIESIIYQPEAAGDEEL